MKRGEATKNTSFATNTDSPVLMEPPELYSEWADVQYLVSNLTKTSCRPVHTTRPGRRNFECGGTSVRKPLSPIQRGKYPGSDRPSGASPPDDGKTTSSTRDTEKDDTPRRLLHGGQRISAYALVQRQDREAASFDYRAEALRPVSSVTIPLPRRRDEIVAATRRCAAAAATKGVEASLDCWERLYHRSLEGKYGSMTPSATEGSRGYREGPRPRPRSTRGMEVRDKVLLTQKNLVLHNPLSPLTTLERRKQEGKERIFDSTTADSSTPPVDLILASTSPSIKELVAHRKDARDRSHCRYEGERLQRFSERRIAAARLRKDLLAAKLRVRKRNRERIAEIRDCRERRRRRRGVDDLDDGTALLKIRMRAMEKGMICPSKEEEDNEIFFGADEYDDNGSRMNGIH